MPKLQDYTLTARPTPRFGGAMKAPAVVRSGGEELGHAVKGFGEALLREKIKVDKVRVEDAYTQAQQKALELANGEDGYMKSLAGDVATNDKFMSDYLKRYDDNMKEVSGRLGNSDQTEAFARRAEALKVGVTQNLMNHISKQKDVYDGQVYKGGVATELDLVATDPTNKSQVLASLNRTDILTKAEANRLGIKGKAKDYLLKENKSNIHETAIRQLVDDNNYGMAKKWFDDNKKNILGEKHGDLEDLIKESDLRGRSQIEVDKYMAEGLSHKEALAKARKLEPELRDLTETRINRRYGEEAKIKDADQKDAAEDAWKIASSEGIEWVPTSMLNRMDGKERAAMEKYYTDTASGQKVKTNYDVYYKVRQMAADDPAGFSEQNLMVYRPYLSDSKMDELIKMQTDEKKLIIGRSKSQIMKQGAIDAGIDKKQVKAGFGDDLKPYYQRIDEELEAMQLMTGKQATNSDVRDVVNRMNIEVIRERNIYPFGDKPFRVFGDIKELAGSMEIEGIPTDMVDELAEAVFGSGQPVTEKNIRLLYEAVK